MTAPPLHLSNPFYLALKAGLAVAVALGCDALTGNPDHVSSTFVAILCLTPMVVLGLRRAGAQALGALIGGGFGAAALLLGLETWVGVPLAVGATVLTWLLIGRGVDGGFAAAVFTALFVQLVPFGGVWETIEVRVLAVGTGAASGFLVNLVVSGAFARDIYERRLQNFRPYVRQYLPMAVEAGPGAIDAVFATAALLERELVTAVAERRRFRLKEGQLSRRLREVRALRELAHTATQLYYLTEDEAADRSAVLAWLEGGPRPESKRLSAAVQHFEQASEEAGQLAR